MQSPFQLLLDLFDEARPAPIAVRPAPTVPTQDVEPSPGEPLAGLLAPQAFRHPDANREARLGEVLVAYEFRRARRKNIGFAVGPEGLVVSAPRWVPLSEVEQALRAKSRWIVNTLEAARERRQRLEAARITWRDGASFPYLGEPVILVLDPRHDFRESGGVLHTDSSTLPGVARQTLHIGLQLTGNVSEICYSVQDFLMRHAFSLFIDRLYLFAPRLNV
ncbi:MAG: YgjP-like metallopeptidase domain-containing protein, partial [Burkholderiales bacterium]